MTGVLTFLLITCLMWGAECGGWSVSIPENLEVMAGSSLTIPCTFDINNEYQNDLNSNCKAIWKSKEVDGSYTDSKLKTNVETTGDLTKKNCTTVLKNLCPLHSDKYYLRLDCNNRLKWTFEDNTVNILVKGAECGRWNVSIPEELEVMAGSSLTIPCTFDVNNEYQNDLNSNCKAIWKSKEVDGSYTDSKLKTNVETTGDLTKKNCTTVLKNLCPLHSDKYYLRLDCNNRLKWTFEDKTVNILVKGAECGRWNVSIPEELEVMAGSSLTIPCTFDVDNEYQNDLNSNCKTIWKTKDVDEYNTDSKLNPNIETTGDLTKKNCTTVLKNLCPLHSDKYYFRLDCNNHLKWTFEDNTVNILVKGAECGRWNVSIPEELEVMAGSSLTIPCTFDVNNEYQNDLNSNCTAIWKSEDVNDISTEIIGDITKKNCTTVLKNLCPLHSDKYYFRLQCDNRLKYNYKEKTVNILVKDSVTLKPSTLEVKEGTSVSLSCSAPAVCLSHPPTLTWTSSLEDIQRTLQENQDKTQVAIPVLNFTASHLHHGKIISCSAVYRKPDGSPDEAVTKSLTAAISYTPKDTNVSVSPSGPVPENRIVTLTCSSHGNPPVKNYSWFRADGDQETFIGTGRVLGVKALNVNRPFFCIAENDLGDGRSNKSEIDVQFPPQILFSSGCTKTGAQINCSCETEGNPFPSVHWYLDGLPVNQSSKFAVSTKSPNDKHLSSVISVNQTHDRDLSTLLCRSFNSLGSASHQFAVNSPQVSTECQDQVPWLVCLGATSCILPIILVLVGVGMLFMGLLVVLFKFYKSKIQLKGEMNTGASGLPLITDGNELSNIEQDDNSELPTHRAAVSHPCKLSSIDNEEGVSKSFGKKGKNMIYSCVNWRRDENSVYMSASHDCEEEEGLESGIYQNFISDTEEITSLYEEVHLENVRKEVDI